MNKKGFTLVEVLVSVVLVAIVMISMLASLVKIRNTYSNINKNSEAVLFSSTISRVLNNDVFNNSGIRRYICSADNMKCDLILGNDQYRVLEIIDSTNTDEGYGVVKDGKSYKLVDATGKKVRVLGANIKNDTFTCNNLKGNCLSISVDEGGYCRCSKEREITTLRYSDPISDKTILLRSINLEKNIDEHNSVTSTVGYRFKYIDSFSRAYHSKTNGETIADVISVFTIYVYDGLDSNDETYNIHLASSSVSNNSAEYVGNRYELMLGLGKYEASLRAKDETNLISDKSGNYIGSIYENFGVGFSSPYGPPISQIGVPYVSDSLDADTYVSFIGFYDCLGVPAGDINDPNLNETAICNPSTTVNGNSIKRVIDEFGNILINSNYYHEDKQLTALWGTTKNVDVILVNDDKEPINASNSSTIHERYATGWFALDNSEVKISSVPVPTKQGSTFGGYFSAPGGTGTRYINPDGSIVGVPNFKYDPENPNKKFYLYAYWVETSKTYTFDKNNLIRNFVAPYSGIYQLEVWGAQGGGTKGGGLGSYSTGVVFLTKGQVLYVVPGGAGKTGTSSPGGFNGGGSLGSLGNGSAGSGGGATHIASTYVGTGRLSEYASSTGNVLIAAGGGGGASGGSLGVAGGNAGGYRSNLGGGNNSTNEEKLIYAGFRYKYPYPVVNGSKIKVTDWDSDVRAARFGEGEPKNSQGCASAGGGGYYGGIAGFLADKGCGNANNFGSGAGGTGSIENERLTNYSDSTKDISIVKHMFCLRCDTTLTDEQNFAISEDYAMPDYMSLSSYTTYNETNIAKVIGTANDANATRMHVVNSLNEAERAANCSSGSSEKPIADCAKKGDGAARITLIEMDTESEEGKLNSSSTYYVTLDYDGGVSTINRIFEKYGSGWALNADDKVHLYKISIPTKNGYLFGGFYTDRQGQGTPCIDENGAILMDPNYVNDNNLTLYAFWVNAKTDYSTGFHTYEAERAGLYRIELWGAGGGNINSSTHVGGHGGYTTGVVELNAGEKLYVYVGGTSTEYSTGGYNGGGPGSRGSYTNMGGGGASHVSLVPAPETPTSITYAGVTYSFAKNPLGATLNNAETKDQVILVAGGGGGQTSSFSTGNVYLGDAGGYEGRIPLGGTVNNVNLIGFGQKSTVYNTGAGGGGYNGGRSHQQGAVGNTQNCGGGGTGFINHERVIQTSLDITRHMTCFDCANSSFMDTMTYVNNTCESTNSNYQSDCPTKGGNNGHARVTLLKVNSE